MSLEVGQPSGVGFSRQPFPSRNGGEGPPVSGLHTLEGLDKKPGGPPAAQDSNDTRVNYVVDLIAREVAVQIEKGATGNILKQLPTDQYQRFAGHIREIYKRNIGGGAA